MKKILPLLCILIAISGCLEIDKPYSTANEQYVIGWILHNVDDQTNTTLDYTLDDLAVYNYSFNYPAQQPEDYSNVLFWCSPIPNGGYGFTVSYYNKISVPVDRVYYVMGKNPVPENYWSNWSFSSYMRINYLTSNNTDLQFAYEDAHEEHSHNSEDTFHALTPAPGDRIHVYFGTAPLTPTNVVVSNNSLKLGGRLMKGYGGESYLQRYTTITISDLTTGEYITSYIAVPTYQIYLNGSLVEAGNLTALYGVWDYTKLNYSLNSDGFYILNVTIPSDYPAWNITRILAYFKKPSQDLNPPTLNHLEASPRFRVNESIKIEINASDDSNVSYVKVYFNTGNDGENWSELNVGFDGLVYNTSFVITNSSVDEINVKVNITDAFNNSVTYTILPIAIKERGLSLNFTSNKSSIRRGETIGLSGECRDEFGKSCGGLRLEYYLDSMLLGVDVTDWSDYEENAGKFESEVQVPYNFTSTNASISVVFKGTGVYPLKQESIILDVTQHEHDLSVSSLTSGTFRLNASGIINASVQNIGLSNEADVYVRLFVNGKVSESIHLPFLNASESAVVQFNWTPTEAGSYSVNVSVDAVPGETSLGDNSLEESVVVGSDVLGWINLDISGKTIVNESQLIIIGVGNIGEEKAINPRVRLYDMYPSEFYCLTYNETLDITFGSATYTVTAFELAHSKAEFNISYDGTSSNYTLFTGQLVELDDGVIFDFAYLDPSIACIYLENASLIFAKNLSDIRKDESVAENINWTPTSLGYHRLKLMLNASNDGNPLNNYDSMSVNVILDMTDVYVYAYKDWLKAVVNKTNNVTVVVYNFGSRKATNVSFIFSDMFEYGSYSISFGEETELCYADSCYNITASSVGEDRVNLTIQPLENSTEILLYSGQLVPLGDEVFLQVSYVSSTYVAINLGKVDESILRETPDIAVDAYIEETVGFTPYSLGNHVLIISVNSSEDANLKDNLYSDYISVVNDAPDVSGYIDSLAPLMVNSTTNVTVVISNDGVRNASNTTLILLQKHDEDLNYTTINDIFVGDMEVGDSREFVLNWTPNKVGFHVLRLEVNCSGDGDLTNNVNERSALVSEKTERDAYEVDDTYLDAASISTDGSPQYHSFYPAGDLDWVKFLGVSELEYTIETFNLSEYRDTAISLYDADGTTLLGYNDDYLGLASRIDWNCTKDGVYYVKTEELGGRFGSYGISVNTSSPTATTTTSTTTTTTTTTTTLIILSQNVTKDITANETEEINATNVNVSIVLVTQSNVSQANITVTSYSGNPTNVSFSVPGLNRYYSIDACDPLKNSLASTLLKFYYNQIEVDDAGLDESRLAVYWFNESLSIWQRLDNNSMSWVYASGVNTSQDFVWANVSHFSRYTTGFMIESREIAMTAGLNMISLPLTIIN